LNGYALRNSTCKKICAEGCYDCDQSNSQKCLTCVSGYNLNQNNICEIDINCNDAQNCTVCPEKWAIVNGTCEMCNLDGNCTQCANGNLSLCINCKPSFFLNNTVCLACN